MVCVDYAWYIFADDPAHPDAEPHTFALFRMSDVTDNRPQIRAARDFDLEATLRHTLGIDRSGPVKTVELLFDTEVAGYVQEHFWHATEQFGIADDGRLLLTMTVAINPELEGKIRRWTPNVEVIGPPELRDTFKQHAAKEYARYHRGCSFRRGSGGGRGLRQRTVLTHIAPRTFSVSLLIGTMLQMTGLTRRRLLFN